MSELQTSLPNTSEINWGKDRGEKTPKELFIKK